MSQAGIINVAGGGGGGSPIQTITGDTGGAITPSANNINLVGGPGVSVAGVLATHTLTINVTGVVPSYVNVTFGLSPYTVTATDYFISCDTSGGPITILAPNAPTTGDQFIIKDRTGNALTNNITLTTVGGVVLIDGSAVYTFDEPYEAVEMLFNGTSYEIF